MCDLSWDALSPILTYQALCIIHTKKEIATNRSTLNKSNRSAFGHVARSQVDHNSRDPVVASEAKTTRGMLVCSIHLRHLWFWSNVQFMVLLCIRKGNSVTFRALPSTNRNNVDVIPHLQLLWRVIWRVRHDRRPYICTVATHNWYSPCDWNKTETSALQAGVLWFLKPNYWML